MGTSPLTSPGGATERPPAASGSLRDPRSIVTPDAFEISEALLGLPLASPKRRLAALAIDGAVIAVIVLVTKSFSLILGIVAAALFIRASTRRTEVRNSVFGRAMRFSLGCLGVVIGGVTTIVWIALGPSGSGDDLEPTVTIRSDRGVIQGVPSFSGLLQGIGGGRSLVAAEDDAAAMAAAEDMAEALLASGVDRADVEEAILEVAPGDAPWSGRADAIVASAVDRAARRVNTGDSGSRARAPEDGVAPDLLALEDLSASEALAELEALRAQRAASLAIDPELATRIALLERRLVTELAADTLALLESRLASVRELAEERSDDLREAEAELEAGRGFLAWVRGVLDELGIGFGWASLYMTVVLSAGKGQTIGKKLAGIRVMRLDGGPITWWVAFERVGGYAAGLATGMLGFAQVYWDANRQAIHDRIVGTVVVRDGAERIGNWEEAL